MRAPPLPLAAFKNLYEVEAAVRDADPAERHARRQAHSKFVYQELIAWCRTHRPHEPPASPLGRAINYLLNNEIALTRFLDDGLVPIDNGVVERLHVRAALTRKNYLFAGSDTGGHRAAIAYTILGSCRLAEVDPLEYLGDVMPRLSRRVRLLEIPALLPANWKAARNGASATPRPPPEPALASITVSPPGSAAPEDLIRARPATIRHSHQDLFGMRSSGRTRIAYCGLARCVSLRRGFLGRLAALAELWLFLLRGDLKRLAAAPAPGLPRLHLRAAIPHPRVSYDSFGCGTQLASA